MITHEDGEKIGVENGSKIGYLERWAKVIER
jgi:hypothetical protein